MADRAPRPRIGTSIGVALIGWALVTAGIAGLHVLLEGWAWLLPAALASLAVVLTAAGVRAVTGIRALPPLAALLVGAIVIVAVWAGDTLRLVVVPGADTLERLVSLLSQASTDIASQSIPATATEGIVLLVAILAIGSVIWVDTASSSLRAPALAAVPALALVSIPPAVRSGVSDVLVVAAVAGLLLLLIWAGSLARSSGDDAVSDAAPRPARLHRVSVAPVLLGGAVVAIVALVASTPGGVQPLVPGLGDRSIRAELNPMLDIRQSLERPEPTPVLRYRSDPPGGLYLRLATLRDFDGEQWAPDPFDEAEWLPLDTPPPPVGVGPEVPTEEISLTISVGSLSSRWLPLPHPAGRVTGLSGDWRWDPDGSSARSTGADIREQRYRVRFDRPAPSWEQALAAGANVPESLREHLELPEGLPPQIATIADRVAQSDQTGTPFGRALALERFFLGPDFSYSETAPVEEGYDGSGVDAVARFLEVRSGYCVHFASAMAIMARTLGIPSRVAVGYLPGERLEDGTNLVGSQQLHAWPELFFDGVGWIAFEPTPGRGMSGAPAVPTDAPDPIIDETPVLEPGEPTESEQSPEPEETPTPEESSEPGAPDDLGSEADGGDPADESSTGAVAVAVLLPVALLAVLALVLIPAAIRWVVRARRVRVVRRGAPAAAAGAAWRELIGTSRDHGWVVDETDTVAAVIDRLTVALPDEVDALQRLALAVERSSYAATPVRVDVRDLRRVLRGIRRSAPVGTQLRGFLLPSSLTAGRSPEPR